MGWLDKQTIRWAVALAVILQGLFAVESTLAADGPLIHSNVAPSETDGSLFRHRTYSAAWTASQESNRPILVYVSMSHCPYCTKMIDHTFKRPEVERLVADSYEPIRVDRRSNAKLVRSLHIKLFPTTVLVGPNNKILDVIEGYVDAKRFRRRLQTGLASSRKITATR